MSTVLTLHGIKKDSLPDAVLNDPAALRYTIDEPLFKVVLDFANDHKCQVLKEMVLDSGMALTFDDGLSTDYEIAFPQLLARKLQATFFVTVSNIGKQGYCSLEQLREMAASGMEIGSHGWTHTYLINKTRSDVEHEIVDSKKWLEDQLGVTVSSYAPVGGHYLDWMKVLAFSAGYEIFASMVPGRNKFRDKPYFVKRNHIQSHHSESDIKSIIMQGWFNSLVNGSRYRILRILKQMLGMERYDRWKHIILRN